MATPKFKWTINYRFEGSIEVEAATPDEAQEKFDAMFGNGVPRSVMQNGEWSNDTPERS